MWAKATLFIILVLLTAEVISLSPYNWKFALTSRARNNHICEYKHLTDRSGVRTVLKSSNGHDLKEKNDIRVEDNARQYRSFSSLGAPIIGAAVLFASCASKALAATDVSLPEEELVGNLPPPWIPLLFAVVLVGGTALLTGSLGDVIADGKRVKNILPWFLSDPLQ